MKLLSRAMRWFDHHKKAVLLTLGLLVVTAVPATAIIVFNNQPVDNQRLVNAALTAHFKEDYITKLTMVSTAPGGVTMKIEVFMGVDQNATETNFKGSFDAGGFLAFTLAGKAIYDREDDELYLQINNAPFVASMFANSGLDPYGLEAVGAELDGSWLKLTMADAGDSPEVTKVAGCANELLNATLQQKDEAAVFNALNEHPYMRVNKALADETIRNRTARHYEVTMDTGDQTALYGAINQLDSFKGLAGACEGVNEMLSTFAAEAQVDSAIQAMSLKSELWIDKQTNRVVKMGQTSEAQGVQTAVTMEFVYNKPYRVSKPIWYIVTLTDLEKAYSGSVEPFDDSFYDYNSYDDNTYDYDLQHYPDDLPLPVN